jgi:hypothetical protein
MKVVRLSALRTARLYPQGNTPGTHFCWRLSRPQGHRRDTVLTVNYRARGTRRNNRLADCELPGLRICFRAVLFVGDSESVYVSSPYSLQEPKDGI